LTALLILAHAMTMHKKAGSTMRHSLHGLLKSWLHNNKGTQLLFGSVKESCARCDRGLSRFICYAPHLGLFFVIPNGIFSMMYMECTVSPFGVRYPMKTFAIDGNMVMW